MSQATSFTSAFQQIALSLGITVGASMLQLSLAIRHSYTLNASDFVPAFLAVGFIAAISYRELRAIAERRRGRSCRPETGGIGGRCCRERTKLKSFKCHFSMSEIRMAKPLTSARRPQTSGEEIANSVSAGVGLLAVLGRDPFASRFCDSTPKRI